MDANAGADTVVANIIKRSQGRSKKLFRRTKSCSRSSAPGLAPTAQGYATVIGDGKLKINLARIDTRPACIKLRLLGHQILKQIVSSLLLDSVAQDAFCKELIAVLHLVMSKQMLSHRQIDCSSKDPSFW